MSLHILLCVSKCSLSFIMRVEVVEIQI
jgi:hypothetical protein